MAESFNLQSFFSNYKGYNERKFTPAENAYANMEQQEIKRAEEATKTDFLGLSLTGKLEELGIGKRTLEQFRDTASGMVLDIVNPVLDYLKEHENIFDQEAYVASIQSDAKQMFFAYQELKKDADTRNPVGQKFDSNYFLYGPTENI